MLASWTSELASSLPTMTNSQSPTNHCGRHRGPASSAAVRQITDLTMMSGLPLIDRARPTGGYLGIKAEPVREDVTGWWVRLGALVLQVGP